MNLKDYIHNLQQRPVRERERIAVIATAIGFSVILVIWLVSFNEMNKPAEVPVDQTSASLNDLKNNFQTGKDSIQNMMQDLPNQTGTAVTGNTSPAANSDGSNADSNSNSPTDSSLQNPVDVPAANNTSNAQNDQKKPGVPQLP